jgi:hypothetical protein
VNGIDVHVPEFDVPMLKSRAIASVPPGGATLNWKVTAPPWLLVAVTVQTIAVPIGCGALNAGVMAVMRTVPCAGAHSAASNPANCHSRSFGAFL